MAWAGCLLLLGIVGLAVIGPLLTPYSPIATMPADQLLPPSLLHPAGTDQFGRDVWSRVMWGGRLSLGAGGLAVALAVLPGSLLGLLAGYAGNRVDAIIMRIVDVLLAFPSLLLALTLMAVFGPGLVSAALAVGVAGIPRFTRVVRAGVLRVRSALFVESATALGLGPGRILFRHILPHVVDIIVVLGSLELGYALLNIGALGFLGLGAKPPAPEWGMMLAEGRGYLRYAPWLTVFPGMAITFSVLALNLVGDALRDGLDARAGG